MKIILRATDFSRVVVLFFNVENVYYEEQGGNRTEAKRAAEAETIWREESKSES